jgi:hypothetical protein
MSKSSASSRAQADTEWFTNEWLCGALWLLGIVSKGQRTTDITRYVRLSDDFPIPVLLSWLVSTFGGKPKISLIGRKKW